MQIGARHQPAKTARSIPAFKQTFPRPGPLALIFCTRRAEATALGRAYLKVGLNRRGKKSRSRYGQPISSLRKHWNKSILFVSQAPAEAAVESTRTSAARIKKRSMESSRIRGSILASAFFLFGAAASPVSGAPAPIPPPAILEVILQLVEYVVAQAPSLDPALNGPSATIILPSTASAVTYSRKGIFECVALPQDQPAQVIVQFPVPPVTQPQPLAPEFVKPEPLDGGTLAGGLLSPSQITNTPTGTPSIRGVISAQGKFTFTFLPAHHPGLYQIRLQHGSEILGLRFWVDDPQNPKNNPPVMEPTVVTGDPPPIP